MTRYLLLLAFAFQAHTKPTREPAKAEKPTREISPMSAPEVQVKVLQSPRADLERIFMLHPLLQECFRPEQEVKVRLEGQIKQRGKVHDPVISTVSQALKSCLMAALPKIQLGPGASGAFIVDIGNKEAGSAGGKSFILDGKSPKKLQ